ncbi:hypothetical protein Tco_0315820 [Tanacetum coccineum]
MIVGMDWLSRHKAKIVCHEKVVRIPLPNGEMLRVLGERPKEKVRYLLSAKAKEQKLKDIIVAKRRILAAQKEASEAVNAPAEMLRGLDDQIEHRSDGALYYLDRIWVPLTGDVRTLIMDEAYKSKYSVYPGLDKMNYDLRDMYW